MSCPSWMHLSEQDEESTLPADLRARDPMAARDCGWVEQMTPFIRSHSRLDSWVLDPFCGFGPVCLAALRTANWRPWAALWAGRRSS